jgi:multidrug efflux pump subunit AcrB
MVNLNNRLLQSKGLSPADTVTAFAQQNLVVPSGTVEIGEFEYDVDQNAGPRTVAELNDLPVKQVGNSTVYLRDVALVSQGFAPQTNIVRHDGMRGVVMPVRKTGSASTLAIVQGIRDLLPRVAETLPPELIIQPLADQAIFVRAAVSGVIREAIIAACLTAAMILLFLGSWRSTLIIAVSIPLSILTSVMVLSILGETINIMTLGGLALAVGILVDDATVEVENTNRNLDKGKEVKQAILDGAQQIAVPALVSTLSICIVFAPMFLLSGVPRYLFVPLAEAVVFAMLASYFLSRTLVPTMAMYLLTSQHHGVVRSRNPFVRFQQTFERGFERLRLAYQRLLTTLVHLRFIFIPVSLLSCLAAFLLVPWLGQDFFPSTDSGQLLLHVRAKSGTRIEETARLVDLVEASIRRVIPPEELDNILDNIGLPYSTIGDDAHVIQWPAERPRLLRRPGVFPNRGEFSVVARPLRHPHGASRGAGGHRVVPVRHPHDAQRPRVDGRHHDDGRRHRQQYSDGVLRQGAADAARRRAGGRYRGGLHALSTGPHDRPGHDHRHDPHGPGTGGRRRAECAARARRDRRLAVCHHGHTHLRPGGLQRDPR